MLEEGAYAKFSKWIATEFPTSTTPNMNAISMQLIQRFSSSLVSAKYPSTADVTFNPRASRRKVELSFDVLKNLEENAKGALTGGNVSPVSRKKGKTATNNRRIDPFPFDSMGIAVPTTDAEVRDVYARVLSQLRNVLEVCGFITDSLLRAELNSPRTTSSFSGSQWYRRFSNPHTPRQNRRRKECPPQQLQKWRWTRVNLGAQRFLRFNR